MSLLDNQNQSYVKNMAIGVKRMAALDNQNRTRVESMVLAIKQGDAKLAFVYLPVLSDLILLEWRDKRGCNLLHLVAEGCGFSESYSQAKRFDEFIDRFINVGLDLNQKSKTGDSPLHLVKHPEIAKVFILKGAFVDQVCSNKETPLLRHCLEDNRPVAEVLIDNGANPFIECRNGKDCFSYATEAMSNILLKKYHQKTIDIPIAPSMKQAYSW